MSNEPSNFRTWLMRHVDDQSPVGDIARDVRADDEWPEVQYESFQLYYEHLKDMDASHDALEALEDAWDEYRGWARARV